MKLQGICHCCNYQNVYLITTTNWVRYNIIPFIYELNSEDIITHSLFKYNSEGMLITCSLVFLGFQDLEKCFGVMSEWWVKMQATLNTGHGKSRKLDRLQGDCVSTKQFRVYSEQHRLRIWRQSYGFCAGACRWMSVPCEIM